MSEINKDYIGIDEAGRGCLAGPVVAGAVVLPIKMLPTLSELDDSKKLSKLRREYLYEYITDNMIWSVGISEAREIDDVNIRNATKLAMKRAWEGIQGENKRLPILVDGDFVPFDHPDINCIVKGDALFKGISAASIVAKVYRDRVMKKMSETYPCYDFINNAGYGTKKHLAALTEEGPCPVHRKTFAPVKDFFAKQSALF